MDAVVFNVGCSILASIVYDISKFCLGRFLHKPDGITLKELEEKIHIAFGDKYEMLFMSGEFTEFIQTTYFKDIIENYVVYTVTGKYEKEIQNVKKNNGYITDREVSDFLATKLLEAYDNKTINKPSKTVARSFFSTFFDFTDVQVFAKMKNEDKLEVFLISRSFMLLQDNIIHNFNELAKNIERMMKGEIVSEKNIYKEHVEEYHRILKTNHSQAHVYLLDTFDFAEFYVPPLLKRISSRQELLYRNKIEHLDFLIGKREIIQRGKESYFDDWKYIFGDNGIVYVTGGAGYGKSLFLKKLINDFNEMNILNSSEYLVIYGELKSFYTEGKQPESVVSFLQNSMVKETMMDAKCFPTEMIDYYIKTGRCLILLDALDEVEKQKREELHKKIISYFKNQNPNNKICMTSRNRGFIPEKDVEVFDILPLESSQIESYVDNIIKLGKFDIKDKDTFLKQSSVLVEKGFLNSFLVLSLLLNIYKAERELPENKMELYQKCFDYIAYKREKDKTKAKYDWDLISCMMKDNTFMELAKMCFPNNSDIGKAEIVDMLCRIYKGKYISTAETERAAENFLSFCSDRTELFVPAAGEERYKFFHRSFFEYFYAQYIFHRIREVEDIYNSLHEFDVDSEVVELTLAMMKQKDEQRYQALMEYILQKAEEEAKEKNAKFDDFNLLTLGMQVVDDNSYLHEYINYLCNNIEKIIKYIKKIPNQRIIISVISRNPQFINKINASYGQISKFNIVKGFLEVFGDMEKLIGTKDFLDIQNRVPMGYIRHGFFYSFENEFYTNLYLETMDCNDIISKLTLEDWEELMTYSMISKKDKEKYKKRFSKYKGLDEEKQQNLQKLFIASIKNQYYDDGQKNEIYEI